MLKIQPRVSDSISMWNQTIDIDELSEEIDYSDVILTESALKQIRDRLKSTEFQYKSLILRGSQISASGITILAEALQANTSITTLSLEWNSIGLFDSGVESLARVLRSNATITHMDLRNNSISPTGGQVLARAIVSNRTLEFLDLRWNELGNNGVSYFIEVLPSNHTLKSLLLSANNADRALLSKVEFLLDRRGKYSVENAKIRSDQDEANEREVQLDDALDMDMCAKSFRQLNMDFDVNPKSYQWEVEALKDNTSQQLHEADVRTIGLEEKNALLNHKLENLQNQLSNERNLRIGAQEELAKNAALHLEERISLERRIIRLEEDLNIAKEDRISEIRQTELAATTMEKVQLEITENTRRARKELDSVNRELKRVQIEKDKLESKNVLLASEIGMLHQRIDEDSEMSATSLSENRAAIENLRLMQEEHVDTLKKDFDSRLKSFEDRAKRAEYESQKAETQRQEALRETSRLKIVLEEKVVEVERDIREELKRRYDGELFELSEKIECVQKSRAMLKDELKSQHISFEAEKLKSASELQEMNKEMMRYWKQLEAAKDSSRRSDASMLKVNAEICLLQRKVDKLQENCNDLERDKQHISEKYRIIESNFKKQHLEEIEELKRQLHDAKILLAEYEKTIQLKDKSIKTFNQRHIEVIRGLEKTLSSCIADSFHSAAAIDL